MASATVNFYAIQRCELRWLDSAESNDDAGGRRNSIIFKLLSSLVKLFIFFPRNLNRHRHQQGLQYIANSSARINLFRLHIYTLSSLIIFAIVTVSQLL